MGFRWHWRPWRRFGRAGEEAAVWLVGCAPAAYRGWRRWWRLVWPAQYPVGTLADGRRVRLAELPWGQGEFRELAPERQREAVRLLVQRLVAGGAARIGLSLRDLELLGEPLPEGVCDGRAFAARAFVAEAARRFGGLSGVRVALLGVDKQWQGAFCEALLEHSALPVLYGARAVSLAEDYYKKLGVAIPVFGARKTIRSSQVILLLDPALAGAAKLGGGRVMLFQEVRVAAAGDFIGRFAFNSFPACQAFALQSEEAQ